MTHALVVDDNRKSARLVGEILSYHGLEVRTAHSVPEALAQAQHEPPNLVVTDLHIGSGCGYELTSAITTQYPGVPVVMMSGCAAPDWPSRARQSGASETLQKPFEMNELLSAVERAMAEKKYS